MAWLSAACMLRLASATRAKTLACSKIGQVLRSLDRPFLLGGDFNMSAETLRSSGWLSAIRAKIVHAPHDEPTYVNGLGHGSAIDFFVASDELVPFANKAWVADGASQHSRTQARID